jgi:hypothetical protein
MQFKELRKVCQNWFFAKSLSKSHFSKLLHVSLTLTSLFGNKNLRWKAKFLKSVSILTLLSHLLKISL